MDLIENEWYIEAPWGRIALIAWGDCSDCPVLVCHGKQDTAGSFRPLVSLLPRNYYYIAIDLPGNGKSDSYPPGLPVSVHDLMYSLKVVADHFSWKQFIFLGHSLGTHLGKYFSLCYPGRVSMMIDLDPVPCYYTVEAEDFAKWYYRFFAKYYEGDNYKKFNAPRETAPKYTYDKAFSTVKKNRGLTDEGTKHALERTIEPAGDGLFRFTFDQRMKIIMRPPYPEDALRKLYTSIQTPTFTTLAEDSIARGSYQNVPFIFDESLFPKGNFKVIRVAGNHDVHISYPERISGPITEFLKNNMLEARKSKL